MSIYKIIKIYFANKVLKKQIEEKKQLIELERYFIDLVKTEEDISGNTVSKKFAMNFEEL